MSKKGISGRVSKENKEKFDSRGYFDGGKEPQRQGTQWYFPILGNPARKRWVNENEHNLAKMYQDCWSEVDATHSCRMFTKQEHVLEHNWLGGGSPYDCIELERNTVRCYFKSMGPKFVNDMLRVSGYAIPGFRTDSADPNFMIKTSKDGPLYFPKNASYETATTQ